jgi:hypothetical protein
MLNLFGGLNMDREPAEEKLTRQTQRQKLAREKMAALEAQYQELVFLKQEMDRFYRKKQAASSGQILARLRQEAPPLQAASQPLKASFLPPIPKKVTKPKLETRARSLLMQPLPQLKTQLSRNTQDFDNKLYRASSFPRGKF